MKAVILAGGRGTRLAEYTKLIPKPMVKLNKKPLIVYILNISIIMSKRNNNCWWL